MRRTFRYRMAMNPQEREQNPNQTGLSSCWCPDSGGLNPQSGSGDGLQEHQCRHQIQEQYGNHNEGHVIAVILSHFCVPRMINASGSKQLLFQNRDTSNQGRSVHARRAAAMCLISHALAYAHGFGGSEYVRKAQPVPWHT